MKAECDGNPVVYNLYQSQDGPTAEIDVRPIPYRRSVDPFADIPMWKKTLIKLKVKLFIVPFRRIRYYIFAIKWLYHNREWASTRQKYKALDKAWKDAQK